MSAPLLLAAMAFERRSHRLRQKRHLLARMAVALVAGAMVIAFSAP